MSGATTATRASGRCEERAEVRDCFTITVLHNSLIDGHGSGASTARATAPFRRSRRWARRAPHCSSSRPWYGIFRGGTENHSKSFLQWQVCSLTYQGALLFTSVTSLNLVSCSSSLFVLVFAACAPSSHARFTITKVIFEYACISSIATVKALLVILNLVGVSLVTEAGANPIGVTLGELSHWVPPRKDCRAAMISALAYSLYLVLFSRFIDAYGDIDMNLMFGERSCHLIEKSAISG